MDNDGQKPIVDLRLNVMLQILEMLTQFGTGERICKVSSPFNLHVYNAFLQAIDISIKEKVEFVVFAGDICILILQRQMEQQS